jgi:protein gp37
MYMYFLQLKAENMRSIPGELPLNNLWLGVSAENQDTFDERTTDLLKTPAVIRFVSLEPLLGDIVLYQRARYGMWDLNQSKEHTQKLHWIIAGGETGSGSRPVHPYWIRSLQYQCSTAGVPFFFKSWGEFYPGPMSIDELKTIAKEHPGARVSDSYKFSDGNTVFKIGHKAAGDKVNGLIYHEYPDIKVLKSCEN